MPEADPGAATVIPHDDGSSGSREASLAQSRRIELILRQIDSLPTLPAVAARLLALTGSDESSAREVTELIAADPALSARILSLCRYADRGVRTATLTVEKAVVLLGFNAVRNAVLSIEVFGMFGGMHDADAQTGNSAAAQNHTGQDEARFDRVGFWRHCLAVGVAAELIARQHPRASDLSPSEAFVCGLLHDIGKIALDYLLPKAFAKAVQLAEANQGIMAEYERRILGIDHHTAGKRLAEQWQLPHQVQDCIWLHNTPYHTLPDLAHRRMIGLVSVADLLARRQHIGYSGSFAFRRTLGEWCRDTQLDEERITSIVPRMIEEVEARSRLLGLDRDPSPSMFLQSIQHANRMLGRLNNTLDQRSRTAASQTRVLDAITTFHQAQLPGRSVLDVLGHVTQSAGNLLGDGYYALLYQSSTGQPWLVARFDGDGRAVHQQWVDPPPHAADLGSLNASQPLAMNVMGMLPWLEDFLVECPDMRELRLLPLICGWGVSGLLVHDRTNLPAWRELQALTATWGSAIAAAGQHDGARRLGEQLAEANRALAETQDRLLQRESMARLGEMAAGAAHEMNNPLTIISGRAQLLAGGLKPDTPEQKAAASIVEQSHRLSDLITALRHFTDPPRANRRPTELGPLLQRTINEAQAHDTRAHRPYEIYLRLEPDPGPVLIDPEQIRIAVHELLLNAIQASPKSSICLSVRYLADGPELWIHVKDDGCGMNAHVLAHAKDPFFSSKPAGRQLGMGLTRAAQLAAAHGGRIDLRSTEGTGTTASLLISLDLRV
ncbi:MAG: HDOD domain-containing protein [Phycisphaeraceae bacterium]|nr:HDOD domain-containing protein [Phycisphaeraceae bacterium]